MRVGSGQGQTAISTATADRIVVRGHDLCRDLIGGIGFTAYFYLLVTGRMPTPQQARFLDAVLVAIAEHGLVPNVAAARMTYAAEPTSLQGAVAAGLLGCGTVVLGTSEVAGRMIAAALDELAADGAAANPAPLAARLIETYSRERRRLPGFGHPLHRPADPRAQRLLSLAEQEGAAGPATRFARALDAAMQATARPLPMNVSLAIPAVLLDCGFPLAVLKGIPLLARTASLVAHLAEEAESPAGFALADGGAQAIAFVGITEPE